MGNDCAFGRILVCSFYGFVGLYCSTLIRLILLAKASELNVSSNCSHYGFIVTINRIWLSGFVNESFSTLVNLESL